jgi:SSS family solute:Na+ symporter
VQALFSFFIAPLFGTVLLGMLWKRATSAGGFWGLLTGTLASVCMFVAVKLDPRALAIIALSDQAQPLAEDMYRALWSCLLGVGVTVAVSLATAPRPESELAGLVYGATTLPREDRTRWIERPLFWGAASMGAFLVLQWIFW